MHEGTPNCHQLPVCGRHMPGTHRAEHRQHTKPKRVSLLLMLCRDHSELAPPGEALRVAHWAWVASP